MSNARDRILGRLRARTPAGSPPTVQRPATTGGSPDLEAFCQRLESGGATVERIPTLEDVPSSLVRHLGQRNLAARVVATPSLADLDWSSEPLLDVRVGVAAASDETGIVSVAGGVSECGALLHLSGREDPTTNHFLPDNAVAVVHARKVVPSLEDALSIAGVVPPRVMCLITGPSRTGDIEQRIELGAHGPRTLHVLVVEDCPEDPQP